MNAYLSWLRTLLHANRKYVGYYSITYFMVIVIFD